MKRILYADEENIVDSFRLHLERKGYVVDGVRDYPECLKKACEENYDVIITSNTSLPFELMDGIKMAKQIKEKKNIPIILTTRCYRFMDKKDLGIFDEVISKPYDLYDLEQKVEGLLYRDKK